MPKIPYIIKKFGGVQSGNGALPAHPNWFREVAYQCEHNGAIYYHKQNGVYGTTSMDITTGEPVYRQYDSYRQWVHKPQWISGGICLDLSGKILKVGEDFRNAEYPVAILHYVGLPTAGHLLDGKEYREMPNG